MEATQQDGDDWGLDLAPQEFCKQFRSVTPKLDFAMHLSPRPVFPCFSCDDGMSFSHSLENRCSDPEAGPIEIAVKYPITVAALTSMSFAGRITGDKWGAVTTFHPLHHRRLVRCRGCEPPVAGKGPGRPLETTRVLAMSEQEHASSAILTGVLLCKKEKYYYEASQKGV